MMVVVLYLVSYVSYLVNIMKTSNSPHRMGNSVYHRKNIKRCYSLINLFKRNNSVIYCFHRTLLLHAVDHSKTTNLYDFSRFLQQTLLFFIPSIGENSYKNSFSRF